MERRALSTVQLTSSGKLDKAPDTEKWQRMCSGPLFKADKSISRNK